MNYFFKILVLITMLFFSSCSNLKQEDNILKIGIESIKYPFSYIKNGKLEGFTVDLNILVAKELNMKIEFHHMNWAPLLPALQNKIIDVITFVGITEERKKSFDFSKEYYQNELAIIFRKDNIIYNIKDLKSKKIVGVLGSSEIEDWWIKNITNNQLILADNESLGVQLLKSKHTDGFLIFKQEAELYCKKNLELDYLVIPEEYTDIGFVMRKNSPLLSKINQAIDKLEKNGDIQKLKDKWLNN